MDRSSRDSSIMRARWRRFRNHKRAWRALMALTVLYVLSLAAELLCNERPLYLRVNGSHFFPFLRHYSQHQVLGNDKSDPVDYATLDEAPEFTSCRGNFILRAPVPYGPHQVADPSEFERYRRATVVLSPNVAIGRLNLTPEGAIVRPLGCEPFFPPGIQWDGAEFDRFWEVPPALQNALRLRFANRPAPALDLVVNSTRSDASATEDATLRVVLTDYTPRPIPPRTVRLGLRPPDAMKQQAITLRFDRDLKPANRQSRRRLPPALAPALAPLLKRAFTSPSPVSTNLTLTSRNRKVDFDVTCRLDAVAWPHRPVRGHWMGLDVAGRDVLARMVYGTRTALTFGLLLVGWAMLLGVTIGAVQGYFGAWVDLTAQRLIEIWSALPFLYVMILLGAVAGRSFMLLLLCYGLFNWIGISYYMRAEFLRLRRRAFVEAAICQGLGVSRILWRHLLPNALTPLITLMPFSLVGAIAAITALDYLGFGLPPLTPSWGELLQQAQQEREAWWLILYPSLMLFTVMLLTVLVGEGLRDAFDPKPNSRYR